MILDTNALSAFVDGDASVGQILMRQARAAIPVIVLGEFRYRIEGSSASGGLRGMVGDRATRFEIFPVTDETTVAYAELRTALKHSGRPSDLVLEGPRSRVIAIKIKRTLSPVLSEGFQLDARYSSHGALLRGPSRRALLAWPRHGGHSYRCAD